MKLTLSDEAVCTIITALRIEKGRVNKEKKEYIEKALKEIYDNINAGLKGE